MDRGAIELRYKGIILAEIPITNPISNLVTKKIRKLS